MRTSCGSTSTGHVASAATRAPARPAASAASARPRRSSAPARSAQNTASCWFPAAAAAARTQATPPHPHARPPGGHRLCPWSAVPSRPPLAAVPYRARQGAVLLPRPRYEPSLRLPAREWALSFPAARVARMAPASKPVIAAHVRWLPAGPCRCRRGDAPRAVRRCGGAGGIAARHPRTHTTWHPGRRGRTAWPVDACALHDQLGNDRLGGPRVKAEKKACRPPGAG